MDEDEGYDSEEEVEGGEESDSFRPLTETELAEAEARKLVGLKAQIQHLKMFPWDECPVWQGDIPPEDRDPPWRIPGQRASGYFRIEEIERFLLDGDHPLNESND